MIEEILNKKLRSVILQALIVFIALLACGGTLLLHLKNLRSSVSRDQISLEAQEYKSRIFAQFQYDIQTLSAISALIEGPRDETDRSLLARKLDEANRDGAFVTVAFFDTDLQGVICPPNGEIVTDASLPELPRSCKVQFIQPWKERPRSLGCLRAESPSREYLPTAFPFITREP